MRDSIGCGAVVEQSAHLGSLLDPGIVIAVAVEDDALMVGDGLFYHLVELFFKVICLLEPVGIDPEALGNCGIEHDVCAGDAVCRADHSELELVACKGERRCSVSVGGISCERGQDAYAELHDLLFNTCVWGICLDSLQDTLKLIAEEDRDNSRRCFVCAETVVVACCGYGNTQKILIVINSLDNSTQK